jgi:hypothetical protein
MKSILEELYYGRIHPDDKLFLRDSEYRKISDQISEMLELLKQKLSQQEYEQLEVLHELMELSHSKESCQVFIHGFKLGAKITAEILSDVENK